MKTLKKLSGGGITSYLGKALLVLVIVASCFAVSCSDSGYCTVYFNSNGGTAVETQRVVKGTCAATPKAPTREGYVFVGWCTDISLTTYYFWGEPVTKDVFLYAKWREKTIESVTSVTFITKSLNAVAYDQMFTFKSDGTLEIINGALSKTATWSIEDGTIAVLVETTQSKLYSSKENLTKIPSFDKLKQCTIVYDEGEFTSMYEQTNYESGNKCIVKFDSNDGSLVDDQLVESGSNVTKPSNPTKAGSTFIGWYSDSSFDNEYTFTDSVTEDIELYARWIIPDPVVFSSDNSFTIHVANPGWDNTGTIYYSTDGNNWTLWTKTTPTETLTSVKDTSDQKYKLYFRGQTKKITGTSGSNWVINGSNVSVSGNIMSLLNYPTQPTKMTEDNASCFYELFKGQTALVSAKDLTLPATKLAGFCYYMMFSGCTNLKSVPSLSATELAQSCCYGMFYECKGLTELPEGMLPATSLAECCYQAMFMCCEGLKSLPEKLLPAKTLAEACYYQMFESCKSLESLPEKLLPATTLTKQCYNHMFDKCTGLTTLPEKLLPATTLAAECYAYMFYECSGLNEAPQLPAGTLQAGCYEGMFAGCSALKVGETTSSTPSSGTKIFTCPTTIPTDAVKAMFSRTTGIFTDVPTSGNTYYWYPGINYNANGATSGTVPVDSQQYSSGATVTILDNTGDLAKTGCSFSGWNTKADGSGTDYRANDTFSFSGTAKTLYAKWN